MKRSDPSHIFILGSVVVLFKIFYAASHSTSPQVPKNKTSSTRNIKTVIHCFAPTSRHVTIFHFFPILGIEVSLFCNYLQTFLFARHREREKQREERETSFICGFTTQMATLATKTLKLHRGLPCEWKESKYMVLPPAFSQACQQGAGSQEKQPEHQLLLRHGMPESRRQLNLCATKMAY